MDQEFSPGGRLYLPHGRDMVHMGMGGDDGPYFQAQLLDSLQDELAFVPRVYDHPLFRFLGAHDVAVSHEGPHLQTPHHHSCGPFHNRAV